jgi:phage gpG-like protein
VAEDEVRQEQGVLNANRESQESRSGASDICQDAYPIGHFLEGMVILTEGREYQDSRPGAPGGTSGPMGRRREADMLVVTFAIMGDVVLARAMSRFGEGVSDFRPVWEQIRDDFVRIEGEQFDSEGGRGGEPWAPLSSSYAAWKAKHFPGMPIMRLTGQLWSQLAVGTGLFVDLRPMELHMYPTAFYAAIHQQGSPKTNMPARRLVALTEDDKMGWMKMIQNYVYDKAKEARVL